MSAYKVKPGDSLSKIAAAYGCTWQAIYNSPENSYLRKSRQNPNLIFPGDVLYIPSFKMGTSAPKAKQVTLAPLIIGIYGAGPTGAEFSNVDVKAIADAAGGKMYNGPGNTGPIWQGPVFAAINERYLKRNTGAMQPPDKLILFGYSMGGLGAVEIARKMATHKEYKHIKVALAGIDPVQLIGRSPITLPDNVVAWVNYYQQDESGQGIVDFKWGWPPVGVGMGRISGGPYAPGPKTGPGTNYKLTTKSEGQKVDHITMPGLPKVKNGVCGFIRMNR